MSTTEDFENAPIGATATHSGAGGRAMKLGGVVQRRWIFQNGFYMTNKEMETWGYKLDPPQPTSAQEALELAWELAHEVKVGQVIPGGTRYLTMAVSELKECSTRGSLKINPGLVPVVRTLEPLPDPEPDWLGAPAVMARVNSWSSYADPQVFIPESGEGDIWVFAGLYYRWSELVDVTPLYPKGQDK